MSRREAAKHAADVRWGNATPKGTTREGEASKYKETGNPYYLKPTAKESQKINAIKKAIKKVHKDGGTIYDVCRLNGRPVDIQIGTRGKKDGPKHYGGYGNGVDHVFANHVKPNDITVDKIAKTMILGDREWDPENEKLECRLTGHVVTLGLKDGRYTLISASRDKRTTRKKQKYPSQEPGSTDRNTGSSGPNYADAAPLLDSDRQAPVARPDIQANTTDETINKNFH